VANQLHLDISPHADINWPATCLPPTSTDNSYQPSYSTASTMEKLIERPQTPPRSYLMTPPPTGGHDKRARFAGAEIVDTTPNTQSRHSVNNKEGESPDDFFEELAFLTEILENSDNESILSASDTAPSSPVSATSEAPKYDTFKKNDTFVSLVRTVNLPTTPIDPFPFMRLPLSVRKRVYEHLLVVPGLVCVRQKQTSSSSQALLSAERRTLLPGIAYTLAQLSFDGAKVQISRIGSTNINILCASKEVYAEAKTIMYADNAFEIIRPSNELSPPPDFSVRLFPVGCQKLVTSLNIKIRSFYDLDWLLSGGYISIKNFYRGIKTLTLILELDSVSKGFGKMWARKEGEEWADYVKRLHGEVAKGLFRKMKRKNGSEKVVPGWMKLRVLFAGEAYDEKVGGAGGEVEQVKKDELKQGLGETWNMFKNGGK
jgi:hypothetical protein